MPRSNALIEKNAIYMLESRQWSSVHFPQRRVTDERFENFFPKGLCVIPCSHPFRISFECAESLAIFVLQPTERWEVLSNFLRLGYPDAYECDITPTDHTASEGQCLPKQGDRFKSFPVQNERKVSDLFFGCSA